jgi:hypothetical protein
MKMQVYSKKKKKKKVNFQIEMAWNNLQIENNLVYSQVDKWSGCFLDFDIFVNTARANNAINVKQKPLKR